ncbi:MAG: nitroreductase family protein [Atopobiaceae bacterium]|jgi:nitroreductase
MEAIFKRSSVRAFTDEPIPEEILHDLLHAGMSAPTANNARPWHFVLVTDKDVLESLPADPYTQATKNAQAAIVVCGDTEKDPMGGALTAVDCGAATENILVEAAGHGLGSVWYAAYPMEARMKHVRKALGLPDGILPYVVLPLGWPKKPLEERDRFDSSMVHENRW